MSVNAGGEMELNPLDFMNPRSIDAARDVYRWIEKNGWPCQMMDLARLIDNQTDRLPHAGDQWVPPSRIDDQSYWWWWNGDQDSAPVPVFILRDSGGKYFATEGQFGWNRFQFVEEMGGLWLKVIEPQVPTEVG